MNHYLVPEDLFNRLIARSWTDQETHIWANVILNEGPSKTYDFDNVLLSLEDINNVFEEWYAPLAKFVKVIGTVEGISYAEIHRNACWMAWRDAFKFMESEMNPEDQNE